MARVDQRLCKGYRRECEGTLSKDEVNDADSACICRRVNHANCLIQKKEEEAYEVSQCIVWGEALRALIEVIFENLRGHAYTEKEDKADSAKPGTNL